MVNNKTLLAQLIVRGAIFLVFALGILIKQPTIFLYLLPVLIIANVVLGFINGKRDIPMNIILLGFSSLLYIVLIDYLATILGSIVSGIGLVMFWLWYRKGAPIEKKKK